MSLRMLASSGTARAPCEHMLWTVLQHQRWFRKNTPTRKWSGRIFLYQIFLIYSAYISSHTSLLNLALFT